MLFIYDIAMKPCQCFINKLQNNQDKLSFWYIVDSVFELDVFLKTNYFAKEISSLFIGWNMVNSDFGSFKWNYINDISGVGSIVGVLLIKVVSNELPKPILVPDSISLIK